jgi:hypothetical protein
LIWFGGLIGISTVFPFFAFTFALGRLPAGIVSILVMSEIAFAVVYARLFLGETLVRGRDYRCPRGGGGCDHSAGAWRSEQSGQPGFAPMIGPVASCFSGRREHF